MGQFVNVTDSILSMTSTQLSFNNCTFQTELTSECYQKLLTVIAQVNNQAWSDYRNSREHKRGADIYIIAILGVFASVIVCLLFRSVRRGENIDDQVAVLLASMQIHVDYEERERQRRKLREDKGKAQAWLSQLGLKGIRRLRGRSASCNGTKERTSVCSVPTSLRIGSVFDKTPSRARSCQGYLPEIVVTHHNYSNHSTHLLSAPISAPNSRPSSQLSGMSSDLSCRSDPFSIDEAEERDVFAFSNYLSGYP